jgi:adenylate cyclase
MERDPNVEAVWRSYLTTGKTPEGVDLPWYESVGMRAIARRLPADPRCQICHYPFSGLGGRLVRTFIGLERSKMNPHMCNVCERFAEAHPGGAELEVSLLFADIRGSTALAETVSAYEFGQLINRFYQVTTNVVYEHGGMVEKLIGDEITAFFAPAFTKDGNHARAAIRAGHGILKATGHADANGPWAPTGVGVHSGLAYVGAVGEPGRNIDIAVLGDNVNVAARLAGHAAAGQVVASKAAVQSAGLDARGLTSSSLELKGKEQPVDVWIYEASQQS